MGKEFKIIDKDAILTAIDNLETKQKNRFSANEIAKTYRSSIAKALKKGYSFKEITDIFNANECTITARELEIGFNKLRRNYKAEVASKNLQTIKL